MQNHASAAAYVPSFGVLNTLEAKKQRTPQTRAQPAPTQLSQSQLRGAVGLATSASMPVLSNATSPGTRQGDVTVESPANHNDRRINSSVSSGREGRLGQPRESRTAHVESQHAATPSSSLASTPVLPPSIAQNDPPPSSTSTLRHAASTSSIYVPSFARSLTSAPPAINTTGTKKDASCGVTSYAAPGSVPGTPPLAPVDGYASSRAGNSPPGRGEASKAFDSGANHPSYANGTPHNYHRSNSSFGFQNFSRHDSNASHHSSTGAWAVGSKTRHHTLEGTVDPSGRTPTPVITTGTSMPPVPSSPALAPRDAVANGASAGEPRGNERMDASSSRQTSGSRSRGGEHDEPATVPEAAAASGEPSATTAATATAAGDSTTGPLSLVEQLKWLTTELAPSSSSFVTKSGGATTTTTTTAAAAAASAATTATATRTTPYPILMPKEDMKFIFATLTWNVDLLLILLSNAPNPVELTEKREEEETIAIRAAAAAERERKKRVRESGPHHRPCPATAVLPPPPPPSPSLPPAKASHMARQTHASHKDRALGAPLHAADATSIEHASPLNAPQRPPAKWSTRLVRRGDEDTGDGDHEGNAAADGPQQHLRAVMSLPTLHDLERLTAHSPSIRPSVLEARRHHRENLIALANANLGWDTHNLLSMSTQRVGSEAAYSDNATEDEHGNPGGASGQYRERHRIGNGPLWMNSAYTLSEVSATTPTSPTTTTTTTTTTGSPSSLRLLCGVDPENFPTLEEVEQWLEKGSVRASAASFWRHLQERRCGSLANRSRGDTGVGHPPHGAHAHGRPDASRDWDGDGSVLEGSIGSRSEGGGDRVRRNRTFCFTATATEDGDDEDDDDSHHTAVDDENEDGGADRKREGAPRSLAKETRRPPRLRALTTPKGTLTPSSLLSVSGSSPRASSTRASPHAEASTTFPLRMVSPSPNAPTDRSAVSPSGSPVSHSFHARQSPAPPSSFSPAASPHAANTGLRRHGSTESLLSLLSSSAAVGGGGVQHQNSRKGGRKHRGGRRQHGGRTIKVYMPSITEGPKAHLLYTAPTAEADQLYQQLMRLRQQLSTANHTAGSVTSPSTAAAVESNPAVGSPAIGGASSIGAKAPASSVSSSATTGGPKKRNQFSVQHTSGMRAVPHAALVEKPSSRSASAAATTKTPTTTSSSASASAAISSQHSHSRTSSGVAHADESEESKRRRVMALLMRGAESLRFQPWEIPASLLPPLSGQAPSSSSASPSIAGAKKEPASVGKATATTASASTTANSSFLSGAKLTFRSLFPSHKGTNTEKDEERSSRRSLVDHDSRDGEFSREEEEEENEGIGNDNMVPRAENVYAEEPLLGFDELAFGADLDDLDLALAGTSPLLGGEGPNEYDDDDVSTLNESEEPLFQMPARIGRRLDEWEPGPKSSKFYFYGPRHATLPRVSSSTLTPTSSATNLASLGTPYGRGGGGSMAGTRTGSSSHIHRNGPLDATKSPVLAPQMNHASGAANGEVRSPAMTYSAVVRSAGTEKVSTSAAATTVKAKNAKVAPLRTHQPPSQHPQPQARVQGGGSSGVQKKREGAHGSFTTAATEEEKSPKDGPQLDPYGQGGGTDGGEEPFSPAAAAAAVVPPGPSDKERKASIHAFVLMFFRAFFVIVIAQIRLQDPLVYTPVLPTPSSAPPSTATQQQQRIQPLSGIEVRALLFLRRHFLSFKEVVVRYVMRSDQEVMRRSAQAIFGEAWPPEASPIKEDAIAAAASQRKEARHETKEGRQASADTATEPETEGKRKRKEARMGGDGGAEPKLSRQVGVTTATTTRAVTGASAAPSPLGSPKGPTYKDILTAQKASSAGAHAASEHDMQSKDAAHGSPTGVATSAAAAAGMEPLNLDEHKEDTKAEASAPLPSAQAAEAVDLLFHSKLLHSLLTPEHVSALQQLSDRLRQEAASRQQGRGASQTDTTPNLTSPLAEDAPYCETDDVEPLAIEQLYLSGKDAAWQPLLLDAFGITRVLQCYPENPNSLNNGSVSNPFAAAAMTGQDPVFECPVHVDLPPLAPSLSVPPNTAVATAAASVVPGGNTLVPHQQMVLGALKTFLLQPPTPAQVYKDASEPGSANDTEESEAYRRYLMPYMGNTAHPGAPAAAAGSAGVLSPSCGSGCGAPHGLLDPLHWIPYACIPSPYSTATSNYTTELYVAQLPVSGRLLYRWVIPAEDTERYNLSVFFQSSLFSFLQGGAIPAPTTERGFVVDFQLHRHQQQQQQRLQAAWYANHGQGSMGEMDVPSFPQRPESTLVHCSAGMHRSCGMVVAFLMWLLYQCTLLTHRFLEHGASDEGVKHTGDASSGRGNDTRPPDVPPQASIPPPTASPDAADATTETGLLHLSRLFQELLVQQQRIAPESSVVQAKDSHETEESNLGDSTAAAAMAAEKDYRQNPMMSDASAALLRAMRHVKQQRCIAEPIGTVQFLLKHFAAELQLP